MNAEYRVQMQKDSEWGRVGRYTCRTDVISPWPQMGATDRRRALCEQIAAVWAMYHGDQPTATEPWAIWILTQIMFFGKKAS